MEASDCLYKNGYAILELKRLICDSLDRKLNVTNANEEVEILSPSELAINDIIVEISADITAWNSRHDVIVKFRYNSSIIAVFEKCMFYDDMIISDITDIVMRQKNSEVV